MPGSLAAQRPTRQARAQRQPVQATADLTFLPSAHRGDVLTKSCVSIRLEATLLENLVSRPRISVDSRYEIILLWHSDIGQRRRGFAPASSLPPIF